MASASPKWIVLALVAFCAAQVEGRAPRQFSATDVLNLYDRGDYERVVTLLTQGEAQFARDGLRPGFVDTFGAEFEAGAQTWLLAAAPDHARHRRLVAAAVALEIAHARQSESWVSRAPLVVWACGLVRQDEARPPTETERWWYLASIATMQEFGGWFLLSAPATPVTRDVAEVERQEGPSGHLAHARTRFPAEPRFLLAQVEASELQTMRLGSLQPGVESHGQLRSDEIPPDVIADLRRRTADATASADQRSAAKTLEIVGRLPQIANGYASLSQDPEVRGEAALRLGVLAAREMDWDAAIAHLQSVPQLTNDSFLVYLSHDVRGWALQHTNRRDEAIAAYTQALSIVPQVRATTTLLSAQLFLSDRPGDREHAYARLDAAYKSEPPVVDPWRRYNDGDARLWSDFMTHLREALR